MLVIENKGKESNLASDFESSFRTQDFTMD